MTKLEQMRHLFKEAFSEGYVAAGNIDENLATALAAVALKVSDDQLQKAKSEELEDLVYAEYKRLTQAN